MKQKKMKVILVFYSFRIELAQLCFKILIHIVSLLHCNNCLDYQYISIFNGFHQNNIQTALFSKV